MDQDFRKWPPGTLMLLATLEAGEASGRDLATWSVDALAAGFDSTALRRTDERAGSIGAGAPDVEWELDLVPGSW